MTRTRVLTKRTLRKAIDILKRQGRSGMFKKVAEDIIYLEELQTQSHSCMLTGRAAKLYQMYLDDPFCNFDEKIDIGI